MLDHIVFAILAIWSFVILWTILSVKDVPRVLRISTALFWGAIAVIFADAALAQATDAATADVPGMTWKDFFAGLWEVVYPYLSGSTVVAFLMGQARAWVPALGNLGIFTFIGDIIAGNYRLAKNAPK